MLLCDVVLSLFVARLAFVVKAVKRCDLVGCTRRCLGSSSCVWFTSFLLLFCLYARLQVAFRWQYRDVSCCVASFDNALACICFHNWCPRLFSNAVGCGNKSLVVVLFIVAWISPCDFGVFSCVVRRNPRVHLILCCVVGFLSCCSWR